MPFLLERALRLVVTLVLVSIATFLLVVFLPGDPALQVLDGSDFTEADYQAVREDLQLDEPLPVRYASWAADVARGDLGTSYRTNQPVLEAIVERVPVTFQIVGVAVLIALLVAVPLAMIGATRAGTKLDSAVSTLSLALLSIPNFMLALLLIFYLSAYLGWFPATGWVAFSSDPVASLRTTILPALALAGAEIGIYTRLLRTDLISTLQDDFITLARSKGASTTRVLFRHALRPSSLSLATVIGVQLGALLGGSVIVETIFAIPGIGRLLVDSIFQRDLLIVQGVVLFIAVVYVLANFAVDLTYSVLDPRIRRGAVGASS
jgi:peptide/nickel transport system permease protein